MSKETKAGVSACALTSATPPSRVFTMVAADNNFGVCATATICLAFGYSIQFWYATTPKRIMALTLARAGQKRKIDRVCFAGDVAAEASTDWVARAILLCATGGDSTALL